MVTDCTLTSGVFQGAHYRVAGEGPSVLLLHGFPLDGSIWDAQIEALQKEFRLIVPDLPGFGSSPLTGDWSSMPGLADYLKEVMEDARSARCVLIGHSMGGYIALAFAEKYPGLLSGFGLMHSSALPDSPQKILSRMEALEKLRQQGTAAFVRQMIPGLFSPKFREAHPGIVDGLIEKASILDPATLAAYYQGMMERPDRTQLLQNTSLPLLFIAGSKDPVCPAELIVSQIPLDRTVSFHVLEAAHMSMSEATMQVNDSISVFIHWCAFGCFD